MRLIDADKLADKLEKEGWALYRNYKDSPTSYVYETKKIDSIPTIDAVEVVQCKDCKHFVRSEGVCKLLSNNYEPPVYVDDDDFCSRGERRSE